jgi:hypothetical protein
MNFAQLVTNIGKWVNRTNGEIDDIIAQQVIESQYELEKKFPLWFLIDEYTHAIASGATSVIVPDHTIRILDIEVEDSSGIKYPLLFGPMDRLRELYPNNNATLPDTGRPQVAAVIGHLIKFAPQADAAYTLHITTHHHLDPLSTTNTSNTWTTTYLTALRLQTLIDLTLYIGDDDRVPLWKARLNEVIADLEGETRDADMVGMREAISEVEDLY